MSSNTNTAISTLVSSQLPAFVRDDNPLFVAFLEAYYEYLEKQVPSAADTGATGQGRAIEKLKKLPSYRTLESTLADFKAQLYSEFLQMLPTGANNSFVSTGNVVDFDRILPKIKDFYRSRGTEKSYRFLIRLLTGGAAGDDTSLYYPKTNVLKASDGKWFIQRSIRVSNTSINGTQDSSLETFNLFTNKKIKGLSSNSTAIVDRVEQFFELGTQVNEIFLSSISNTFIGGETVQSNTVNSTGNIVDIRANIFSGFVSSVSVVEGGKGYLVGDPVLLIGGGGTGATAAVSEVTRGNIESIQVTSGGSGYTVQDFLVFSGGGGTGANAKVSTVLDDGSFHPNSYNIVTHSNSLSFIANSTWNASGNIWTVVTSNLAQNSINSLGSVFTYTNTGPASIVTVLQQGVNYTSLPTISVSANAQIVLLGILGSLKIQNPGTGYSNGDQLIFTNPFGGWGHGANGNVASVNGTGAITSVQYTPEGDINSVLGGTGYENGYLPTITIQSSGGSGANVVVDSTLGTGAVFSPDTGQIGTVISIAVISGGTGYTSAPVANLSGRGDGTATALVAVIQGLFTYPGYFLNQDGFPSSFNFLQDRDYYQNYAYVLRAAKTSFTSWIQSVLNLVHPSGLKVFGEYLVINDNPAKNQFLNANTITGSFGYDSIRSTALTPESNAIYFPGNSFVWSADSFTNTANGTSNTHAAFGSFWFKLDPDAPNLINVGGPEMTIFEIAGPPPSYNAAHKVFIGRAKDPAGVNFIPWSSNLEVTGANTWTHTNITIDKNVLRISIPDADGNTRTLSLDRMRANTGVTGQYFLRHAFGGVAPFPSPANTLYDTGNKQVIYSFYSKSGSSANNDRIAVRIQNAVSPSNGTIFYCNTVNGHVYQTTSNIGANQGYAYSNVTSVGNGVYRFAFFTNPTLTTTSTQFDILKVSNSHSLNIAQTYSYPTTESANDGIIIGGFQIEPGNIAPSIHVTTNGTNLPTYVYSNTAPSELFVGFRFKNVITGNTQAEFRTDYRKNPIVANNWYHVLVSANLCSNGVYHEIPFNQGIFLNNVYSQIVISTTGSFPSEQSANLAGVAHASFGGNTYLNYPTIDANLRTLGADASRGGLKYKGYIGDFFWQPNYTINANPNIVSVAPQVYAHMNAFLVSNTLSSNVLGIGPEYGGSGANLANIGISVSSGAMIRIEPRYFFKGTTGPGRAGQFAAVPPSANLANLNSGSSGFEGSYHDANGNTLFFVSGATVQEPVAANTLVPKGLQPGPGEEY
jgi:hypothetical protein